MTYLKRNKIGNFWPIPRKGTKYLAVASHNQNESIPLSVILRDILRLVKNKKELKRALNEKQVLINNKQIKETNYPVCLFDILTIGKKNYKAILSENKKMIFREIENKDSETKIYKILNKKKLGEDKIQLNLTQGKNILSNEKIEVGDSVILNLKDNKIIKKIPLEKGRTAFAIKGKHAGKSGKILEIMKRGSKKIAKIEHKGERINVWIKNIILTE